MNYALTNFDIKNILGNDCLIIKYKELHNFNDLDKLMKNKKFIVILYEYKKNYGHWTCLLKQGRTIEFFDPYGTEPDMEIMNFTNYIRNKFKCKPIHFDIDHIYYIIYDYIIELEGYLWKK